MSDVKVERKESISREDAAGWLELVSKAFAEGSHVELPFGAGAGAGAVSLHVPDQVHAEFEVEVEGDEVEVELEFKWSTARPGAAPREEAEIAPEGRPRRGSGARGSPRTPRPQRR